MWLFFSLASFIIQGGGLKTFKKKEIAKLHPLVSSSSFLYFTMSNSYTPMPTKKSYNISEAKLKRILEYNERLREQLDLPRIPVSEASTRYV